MKRLLLLIIFTLICLMSHGQLVVPAPAGITASQLATAIVSNPALISNVTETGKKAQRSTFSNSPSQSNINISSGVIMTSGRAARVTGGNKSDAESDVAVPCVVCTVTPDADLQALIGGKNIFDLYKLEFDFTTTNIDTIVIEYVFGSEEYLEYAPPADNTGTFNDVFGFFIKGNEYPTATNFALIPGSSTIVSVNSINPANNPAYYINNPYSSSNTSTLRCEYDGFTTVLRAKIKVTQNKTYHIKLAIADVGDDSYDSGIFIKGNTIGSVLPIELLSFNYTIKNDYVQLTWKTVSESNNSHFEIEKSLDGISFNTIGSVVGAGNSNILHTYNFQDKKDGLAYYRLKQVDLDGKFTYSNVITVYSELKTKILIKKDNIIIDKSNTLIRIFNSLGSEIHNYNIIQGEDKTEVNMSELPSGVYILYVNDQIVKFLR